MLLEEGKNKEKKKKIFFIKIKNFILKYFINYQFYFKFY